MTEKNAKSVPEKPAKENLTKSPDSKPDKLPIVEKPIVSKKDLKVDTATKKPFSAPKATKTAADIQPLRPIAKETEPKKHGQRGPDKKPRAPRGKQPQKPDVVELRDEIKKQVESEMREQIEKEVAARIEIDRAVRDRRIEHVTRAFVRLGGGLISWILPPSFTKDEVAELTEDWKLVVEDYADEWFTKPIFVAGLTTLAVLEPRIQMRFAQGKQKRIAAEIEKK